MFTLTIRTGNAEMQTPEDVARELHAVADQLVIQGDDSGVIFDPNGNRVGAFKMEAE